MVTTIQGHGPQKVHKTAAQIGSSPGAKHPHPAVAVVDAREEMDGFGEGGHRFTAYCAWMVFSTIVLAEFTHGRYNIFRLLTTG
jgi:hypothetical protein